RESNSFRKSLAIAVSVTFSLNDTASVNTSVGDVIVHTIVGSSLHALINIASEHSRSALVAIGTSGIATHDDFNFFSDDVAVNTNHASHGAVVTSVASNVESVTTVRRSCHASSVGVTLSTADV